MKIIEITVSAGRVIPNPVKRYSTFKPVVSVTAEVDANEDWKNSVRELQAEVEQLLVDHCEIIGVAEMRRDKLEPGNRIKSELANDIKESQVKLQKAREET